MRVEEERKRVEGVTAAVVCNTSSSMVATSRGCRGEGPLGVGEGKEVQN